MKIRHSDPPTPLTEFERECFGYQANCVGKRTLTTEESRAAIEEFKLYWSKRLEEMEKARMRSEEEALATLTKLEKIIDEIAKARKGQTK